MKSIVYSVYDVNPYKGSESGTGWNFIVQGARFNKVIAITRENNRESIEKYISEFNVDDRNIKFFYFDWPYYLRFWKKGARGSSIYFYLWQLTMPLFVISNKINFDIAHNVNFHADAFPTFLWVFGKPVVWGPINHNEKIPREYFLTKKEFIIDRIKWSVKKFNWNCDPFMNLAIKKCNTIIGGNTSVKKRLRIPESKFVHMSQVGSVIPDFEKCKSISKEFSFLVVGRFLTIKSFEIALLAFEIFYNSLNEDEKAVTSINIIGDGPLRKRLETISESLSCTNRIIFHSWVDKKEMDSVYQKSDVFVFPSHEGAGMVVVEALSNGLPVICFDNYGPGEFVDDSCAIKIAYSTYEASVVDYSREMINLYRNEGKRIEMSLNAMKYFSKNFTWNNKGERLKQIYLEIEDI